MNLLFLIALSLFTNCVQAMEVQEAPIESKKTLTKSQKKRSKRKKNKKQNSDPDIIDLTEFEEFTKIGNLKIALDFADNSLEAKRAYLKQLNLLANILLMQKWIIDRFTLMRKQLSCLALQYVIDKTTCLSLREDGVGICGHNKDEFGQGSTKIISSAKAKELISELIAPILLQGKLCNKEDYKKCSDLIKNNKDIDGDTTACAQYVLRLLNYHQLLAQAKNLKTLLRSLNGTIALSLDTESGLSDKEIINNLFASLNNAQAKIIPHFSTLQYFAQDFTELFVKAPPVLKPSAVAALSNYSHKIINIWYPARNLYDTLYTKVVAEIENILETIPSCNLHKPDLTRASKLSFLYPSSGKSKILPQNLLGDVAIEDSTDTTNNSFIDTALLNAKLEKSTQSIAKKKKKRARNRRRHKQEESTIEQGSPKPEKETQVIEPPTEKRHIKFPHYADRIIARFNETPNIEDLYHTYSPVADGFIMKYGSTKQRRNETFRDQMDTKYTMDGTITYENGDILYVEFSITLNENHICYHREFLVPTEKEQSKELSNLKFESNFPTLMSNEDAYIAARLQFVAHNDEIYGQKTFSENSKTIVIKDTRNGVILTLLKPLDNTQMD